MRTEIYPGVGIKRKYIKRKVPLQYGKQSTNKSICDQTVMFASERKTVKEKFPLQYEKQSIDTQIK